VEPLPQTRSHRAKNRIVWWPLALIGVALVIGVVGLVQQFAQRQLDEPLGPTLPPLVNPTSVLRPTSVLGGAQSASSGSLIPTQAFGAGIPTFLPPTQAYNATLQVYDLPTHTSGATPAYVVPTVQFYGSIPVLDMRNMPTPSGAPTCDGPPQLILLLMGLDRRDTYNTGLTDAIRLVRVDFTEPSVSMLAIPRDLFVQVPGLPEGNTSLLHFFGTVLAMDGTTLNENSDYGKINTAYAYGNLYKIPGGGPALLAQTIYHNFGIPADNYLILNLAVFEDLVDAVGGIDIDVPRDLADKEKQWFFTRGLQHMDGVTALQYARIRHPDSDWGRIDRQSQVLLALRAKAVLPENYPRLTVIAEQFIDNMRTDLTRRQISSLLCMVGVVPPDRVRMYAITPEYVHSDRTTNGSAIMLPKMDVINGLLYQFMGGGQ
jgi:LCP family protein required for cell wall assembly